MANTVEIVIQARDNASAPIRGVGSALGDLETRGHSAGGALGGLGSVLGTVASVGFTAVAGAAVGAVAGIGGAVQSAADFQSAMSGVGAVAGASASELAGLSAKALALGMDTTLAGVSASDAATAMEQLASGGVSVADIMGGAAYGALQLASAGGIDVGAAASIAALAMKDFGLAGSDLPHIADLFAAAANTSAVTVTDLGESLQYVGPIASTMGISIEELTGTLAELGDKGIKGSAAGTALRGMISNLAAPTAVQAGVMKDLNLQFFDSEGKMKNVAGIAQELHDKLGGLTDQQRTSALAQLFGNEGLTAAQILYDGGAAAVQGYTDKVNVAGSAAANGALRNDNLKGALAGLGGVWETLTISVGTAFIPTIRGATEGITVFLTHIMPVVTAALPGIVAGLQQVITVAVAFGTHVVSAVQAVVGAFQSLFAGRTNFGQFVGGLETMVGTILGQLGSLATRAAPYVGQFFSAIGTAISTYGPQVAAQFQIYALHFVDWIQTTAIPFLAPRLSAFLSAVTTWITGTALPAAGAALVALGQAFGTWVTTTAVPFLQANVPVWLAALGDWLSGTAIPAVVGFIVPLAERFGTWVTETAIPFLQTNVPLWLSALGNWLTGTAIPGAVAFLLPLAEKFGTWVKDSAIPFLLTHLPAWYLAIEGWLYGTAVPAVVTALVRMGRAFGEWVGSTAVPYLQQHLPEWMLALGNWIDFTVAPAAVAKLHELGVKFGTWILDDAIPYLQTNVPAWLAALVDWLTGTAIPTTVTTLVSLGEKFGTWVTETAVPWLMQHIGEWLTALGGWITGTALPAVVTAMTSLGQAFVKALIDEAQKIAGKVGDEIGKIPGVVLAIGGALYDAGASIIHQLASGIDSAIGAAIQKVRDGLQQIANLLPHSPPADPTSPMHGLPDAGKTIMTMLGDGITAGTPGLVLAGRTGAQHLVDQTKGALGIVGTGGSTLFQDLGESAMHGFALGVKALGDEVWGAVEEKMRAALRTATEYANQIAAVMASAGGVELPSRGETKRDTGATAVALPHLATGGVVTSPTVAVVGDAPYGEAIIPLDRAGGIGAGGGESHVHIYLDGRQITEVVYQGLLGKKRNNTALGLA